MVFQLRDGLLRGKSDFSKGHAALPIGHGKVEELCKGVAQLQCPLKLNDQSIRMIKRR